MDDTTILHQYGPVKLVQTFYYKDPVYAIRHWGCTRDLYVWKVGSKFPHDKHLEWETTEIRCFKCRQGVPIKALNYIVKVAKLL